MTVQHPFYIQQGAIYAIPVLHYTMEMAVQVKLAFDYLQPDCVAVELPENMQTLILRATARLPEISIIVSYASNQDTYYLPCEPCDPAFEGLRSALENGIAAYCIDLDVDAYPSIKEPLPDPYAIQRIGLQAYYDSYQQFIVDHPPVHTPLDRERELHMARRLKELSLSYDRILFVSGMAHTSAILKQMQSSSFPTFVHTDRPRVELCTLTAKAYREVMAEPGWLSTSYEKYRLQLQQHLHLLDRQKLILQIYKEAAQNYTERTDLTFPSYHIRNMMKFVRNYALLQGQLMPDLFKIVTAAKNCVDHRYAYEVWEMATRYPFRKNIDNLPELDVSPEEVWGTSRRIRFHLKEKSRKNHQQFQSRLERSTPSFKQSPFFTICSYQPEDVAIERFGHFLKKKGMQLLTEEGSRTIPFITSLEDGIDTKETIRHWGERKLYVKTHGKPPGAVGSICIIFDEDQSDKEKNYIEKYPWRTTWIGEHQQESDMAFYATSPLNKIVGPGISRCQYGGLMMSYPPRRLLNIWTDMDYKECRTKAEVLLMAAIDYSTKPHVIYVAPSPPRNQMKQFAQRFGKKIIYIPIGQLSAILMTKLRLFHVLDGQDRREIADDYI